MSRGGPRPGSGRKYLEHGEATVPMTVRMSMSMKRKVEDRADALGMTEAAWVRRLIVHALLRVPNYGAGDDEGSR